MIRRLLSVFGLLTLVADPRDAGAQVTHAYSVTLEQKLNSTFTVLTTYRDGRVSSAAQPAASGVPLATLKQAAAETQKWLDLLEREMPETVKFAQVNEPYSYEVKITELPGGGLKFECHVGSLSVEQAWDPVTNTVAFAAHSAFDVPFGCWRRFFWSNQDFIKMIDARNGP